MAMARFYFTSWTHSVAANPVFGVVQCHAFCQVHNCCLGGIADGWVSTSYPLISSSAEERIMDEKEGRGRIGEESEDWGGIGGSAGKRVGGKTAKTMKIKGRKGGKNEEPPVGYLPCVHKPTSARDADYAWKSALS